MEATNVILLLSLVVVEIMMELSIPMAYTVNGGVLLGTRIMITKPGIATYTAGMTS